MTITEALKKTFLARKDFSDYDRISTIPRIDKQQISVYDTNDPDIVATGFFDNTASFSLNYNDKSVSLKKQSDYIKSYREIANIPEVDDAINEIVNEAIFNPDTSKNPIEVDFNIDTEIPQTLQESISEEFQSILSKLNLERYFFSYFYSYYVDGQINFHIGYKEDNKDIGLATISVISPDNLYYDNFSSKWKYLTIEQGNVFGNTITNLDGDIEFEKEEIIRIDSGIYSDKVILSNLHKAIRPANMLKTLEDMLIPMRFSRSVSRRVFNVDASELPDSKVQALMNNYKNTYKYTNFYNVEAGTISKQQHINSLVEDYWFPNRGGSKGTTVDTIDETGNLGETGDLEYFLKKLYKALKVPSSRIPGLDQQAEYDFGSTSISREEIKFYAFITRLRTQFSELFYELLRRQLIYKKKITESEWRTIKKDIYIKYATQNSFFEKMQQDLLSTRYDLYSKVKDEAGKLFSYEFLMKEILKFSTEEIDAQLDAIIKEKKDKKFSAFYQEETPEQ